MREKDRGRTRAPLPRLPEKMIPIAKPFIGAEEMEAVASVLASGIIAEGPKVREFEEEFADYVGVQHAVAVSSGTSALHIALLACGVGDGDEVILPSFTFIASANTVLFCNAKPVFVDVEEDSFNIDPDGIREAVTDRTKAIMPIHLYGHPANMKEIEEIAGEHELKVVEDACQAHGAKVGGDKVGSLGDAGCFSFYPTKNMTSSEGGMITTDDDGVDAVVRSLRQHGMKNRYYHDRIGFNYRMTDVEAAIGLAQLAKLDGFNDKRRENATFLSDGLSDIAWITTPSEREDCMHVYNQYTVKVDDGFRGWVIEELEKAEIGHGIYYPVPIHKQRVYEEMGYRLSLPVTDRVCETVLSLPVHPQVSETQLDLIFDVLHKIR